MLLYQPIDGYCYNSDTIFLYDFIISFKPRGELLDVGSGVGVLGLLVARDSKIHLNQCELQEKMQFFSTKNATVNAIKATIFKDNFLKANFDKKFDYIISNPPFWDSNVIQTEIKEINIARYNHHLPIYDFIKKVNLLLKPRGHFIFCYDAKQIQILTKTLNEFKLTIETIRFVYPKATKNATLVLIQARKNSKSFTKIMPPLYVFEGSEFSDEAQQIYKRAKTHSIKALVEFSKA